MLPLGVAGRTNFRPYMTFALIFVNVVMLLILGIVTMGGEASLLAFAQRYALDVCLVGVEPFPNTLLKGVSSMFLHAGIVHLLGNMMILWIFGPRVEAYFGRQRFLIVYLMMGVISFVAHILVGGTVCVPNANIHGFVVGASGAIAGVMGAFLFLYPGARVRTTIVLFGFLPIKTFFLSAWIYLIYWFVLDFAKGIGWIESFGVAHWAHIGGFIGGFAIAFVATLYKPAPELGAFEYLED